MSLSHIQSVALSLHARIQHLESLVPLDARTRYIGGPQVSFRQLATHPLVRSRVNSFKRLMQKLWGDLLKEENDSNTVLWNSTRTKSNIEFTRHVFMQDIHSRYPLFGYRFLDKLEEKMNTFLDSVEYKSPSKARTLFKQIMLLLTIRDLNDSTDAKPWIRRRCGHPPGNLIYYGNDQSSSSSDDSD